MVWPVIGLAFLASFTYVALNQALVALLGAPGRFLALVLIVLQLSSAGATYPVQTTPPFFQAIHPWLPLSHSVDAFRALIAGSTINVGVAVGYLLIWFAIALFGIAVAVWVERRKIARLTRDAGADAEVGEVSVRGGVNNVPNRASDGLGA
jgi:putative membrane protein